MKVFHTHTCMLVPYSHLHTWTGIALGYLHLPYTCILLHLDTYACILALACFNSYTYTGIRIEVQVFKCKCRNVSVQVQVWKCQCVSVSVEVSVFKRFSGRTLRNAFGKKETRQLSMLPN